MQFLKEAAGIVRQYYSYLLTGVGYTMLLALVGTVAGFCIGLLTGVVRTAPKSRNAVLWTLLAAPIMLPKKREPVSPMKIFAGCRLKARNPVVDPMRTAATAPTDGLANGAAILRRESRVTSESLSMVTTISP